MSVLNPIVETWDGANRRIYLKQGVVNYFPIEDIYHEYRYARRINENLRKYEALLRAEGNIPKGGGAFTPRYVVLIDGTKIIPYNESSQLNQLGDMITNNPEIDSDLYDITQLTVPKPIFIKPSEAETIQLNSASIVYSSFQGAVWYDANSPHSTKGSEAFPNGNTERPVNNIPLAVEIAKERGFIEIRLRSDCTFVLGDDIRNMVITGVNSTLTSVYVEPASLTLNCEFRDLRIAGTLDGGSKIIHCDVWDLEYVNGQVIECMLNGIITLGGGVYAHLIDCYSGIPGVFTPTVNMGGTGQALGVRDYHGGIKITNKYGPDSISVDISSGHIILDTDVTAGDIVLRGIGKLTDLSNGTANVLADDLLNKVNITDSVIEGINESIGPEIQYASFNGGVTIDTVAGVDGTLYPIGTSLVPCKTPANSASIRAYRGFHTVYMKSDVILDNLPDGQLTHLDVSGIVGFRMYTLSVNNSLIHQCTAKNLKVSGMAKPGSHVKIVNCDATDIQNVQLTAIDSTIVGGNYEFADLTNCLVEGDLKILNGGTLTGVGIIFEGDFTTIDMMGIIGAKVSLDIDSGYFLLKNCVAGCLAEFNLRGGEIELDATCTGGDFYLEGYGTLYGDPEALGMTVKGNHLLSRETIPDDVWDEMVAEHNIAGSTGRSLSTAGSGGVDLQLLANAVWDEPKTNHNTPNTMGSELQTILDVQAGNWEIQETMMIFYKRDGTELLRYSLLDKNGMPSNKDVFKRIKL